MLAGSRVGPYEIATPAAIPGAWQWYLAHRVASVRRLPVEAFVAMSPDETAALQAGFEALRRLADPRVPEPIAFYEGHGAIVVSAATGPFLDELVMRRRGERVPMSPATLLDIGLELADLLSHAHRRNLYHGGLWPGRVSIGFDGKLVVWGFEEERPTPPPAWMSPDAQQGPSVGAWTDQWNLAAILGALVTGAAPGNVDDLHQWLAPVELQWPALARSLRRAMSVDPQDRFPTIDSFREDLLALSRKAGGVSDRAHLARRLAAATAKPAAAATIGPNDFGTEDATELAHDPAASSVGDAPPVRQRPRPRPLVPSDDATESIESAPTEQIRFAAPAARLVLDPSYQPVIPLPKDAAYPTPAVTPPLPHAPSPPPLAALAEPAMNPPRPTLRIAEPTLPPEALGPHTDPDAHPVRPATLLAMNAMNAIQAGTTEDAVSTAVPPTRVARPRANPTIVAEEPVRIALPTLDFGPVPPPRPASTPAPAPRAAAMRVDVELDEEVFERPSESDDEPELLLSTIDLRPEPTPSVRGPASDAETSFDLGLDGPRIQQEDEEIEVRIAPRREQPITKVAQWAAGFMLFGMTLLTAYNVSR
jgi:hypothetical protein